MCSEESKVAIQIAVDFEAACFGKAVLIVLTGIFLL